MQGFFNTGFCVKREAGIDLGRNLAGNSFQDLFTKFNQETVEGGINLGVDVLLEFLCLRICDGNVDKLGIFSLFGGGENYRGVCGSILRCVLYNGGKVALVGTLDLGSVWGKKGE